jgi:PleD family two-component response regulator/EAL domain-containing protein (putative c-di-GMP-specific phosphodiesterase class I)
VVLREIATAGAPRPVWVCLCAPGDISARLGALRGGAEACLVDPVDPEALSGRLLVLCGAAEHAPYRVLVVDDQEVAALFATRVLEKAGMRVRALADSLRLLEALTEFRPDLVLMDLHMPGADGLELTQIIRQQEGFLNTPVVFLSGEVDPNRQMDALRVGGDDFLAKPVAVDLLVDTVRRRIQAARLAARRNGTPAANATGAWKGSVLMYRIDQTIAAGPRKAEGTGVLFLEIDQEAQLEQHPRLLDGVLDVILDQLRRIRDTRGPAGDLAARVGPRGLALLVARENGKTLAAYAEGLRAAIARQEWKVGGEDLALTASIGVGLFQPPADDAITMIFRAKKACALARDQGGNRVEVHAPAVPAGTLSGDHMTVLIREALRSDRFSLAYQPVVPLRMRPGERYEALLRLRTADGELIPPSEFLPVAHRSGLMPEIDRRMVICALDQAQACCGAHTGLQILIRQTLDSAGAHRWVIWLRDEIAQRELIHHRPALIFDLDDVAARLDHARMRFAELRQLGIDICLNRMDDSPRAMQVLAQIPVSLVRLSHGALRELTNERLTSLVETVHGCGAALIATAIEDPQSIGRVWGCGVDFIQGNYIQPAGEGLDFDFVGSELV